MPPAVITLGFDPYVRVHGLIVGWETLALAAAILVGLLAAARFARGSGRRTGLERLRLDDLLYLAVAAVPGAVVGGRILYALTYLDYYTARPAALLDPGQGGLSLLGAVLGGALTSAYLAHLLGAPVGRWLDVASSPLLLTIGLARLAELLAGAGQGAAFTGAWAVAFVGPGPWLSPAPDVPAHPAQVYAGLWALLGVALTFALHAGPLLRRLPDGVRQTGRWSEARRERGEEMAPGRLRFGYLFLAALGWLLLGTLLVGFTTQDPVLVGPLSLEQALSAGLLVAGAGWVAFRAQRA